MSTYRTLNQLGEITKGTTFEGSTFSDEQLTRFLELGSIELIEGEVPSADAGESEKDAPKLAKLKKANTQLQSDLDAEKAKTAAADEFVGKVKAYVDTLSDDEKKAFQDAVNPPVEPPVEPKVK